MTTYNHTPTAGVGNEAVVNDILLPDAALDAAIGDRSTLTTTDASALANNIDLVTALRRTHTKLSVISDTDGTLKAGAVDVAAVLADNVVTQAKLADAAVGTAELVDGSVTSAKIGTGAVDAINVLNASLTNGKFVNDTLLIAKLNSTLRRYLWTASQFLWDPKNLNYSPLKEWDSARSHWYQAQRLSISTADSENPDLGNSLLFLGTTNNDAGKRVYLREITGVKVGDTVTVVSSVKIPTGITLHMRAVAWDTAPAVLDTGVGTGVVGDDATHILTASLTLPANTDSIIVTWRFTSGTGTVRIFEAGAYVTDAVTLPDKVYGASSHAALLRELADAHGVYYRLRDTLQGIRAGTGTRHLLRSTQAQLAKIINGSSTAQLNVAFLGDSWVHEDNLGGIKRGFARLMQTTYGGLGNGGLGYVAFGKTESDADVTLTRAGTWTLSDEQASSKGLDLTHASSTDTATPASIQAGNGASQPATTIVIHYYTQVGGGEFRYRVDAGGWTTVDTDDTAGYATETISGLSSGAHTLDIEVTVAGSQGVLLMGADFQNATAGVRVHNLGNSGSITADWVAVDATLWEAGLALLAPNLAIILLGTNDQRSANNQTATTYVTNLTTLTSRIRTAVPLCDVLWIVPPANGLPGTTTMQAYADAARLAALDDGSIAVLDGVEIFGSFADADSRGLWDGTDLHLTSDGGQVLVNAMFRMLKAQ